MRPALRSFWPLGLASCATLATAGSGDQNLPSVGAGPFQPLAQAQVAAADIAPFVLLTPGSSYTEPSALPATTDSSGQAVLLYVVRNGATGTQIVRSRSADGRSFYGDTADNSGTAQHAPAVVLTASAPWEGTSVSGPSALRAPSGQIWLYYAAAGGIGLARSSDGLTFTRNPQPVLGLDPRTPWEFTPPRAPTVAIFPDGSWHMLYASGDAIGEATSADGESWTRVDADPATPSFDPVLEPSPRVDPSTLGPGEQPPFDEGAVDDPLLVPEVDVTGRLLVRVLYTGFSDPLGVSARTSGIGFAARFGDAGRLSRQTAPVYSAHAGEAAPALLERGSLALLYVQQNNTSLDPAHPFPAIAAAFAPASASLAPAAPFTAGP